VPITTVVDPKKRLVRFTIRGVMDSDEMLASVDKALAQLDDKGGYDILSDHRLVDKPATPEQVKLLMAHLAVNGQRLRGARCAVIVGNEASYGMMRMMSVRAEQLGIDVGVFRELEAALQFLGPRDTTASAN